MSLVCGLLSADLFTGQSTNDTLPNSILFEQNVK